MRTLILIFIFLFAKNTLFSQNDVKIIYINTPDISINDKRYKIGDSFSVNAIINWENEAQVMKVFDNESKNMKILSAQIIKESANKPLLDHFRSIKRLSSRNASLLNSLDIELFFNRKIAMIESLSIDSYLPVNDDCFYYITYMLGSDEINKKLETEGQKIVINRSIYTIDGEVMKPFSIEAQLYYYQAEKETSLLLADNLNLFIVADGVCEKFMQQYANDIIPQDILEELLAEYLRIKYPDYHFIEDDIKQFFTQDL